MSVSYTCLSTDCAQRQDRKYCQDNRSHCASILVDTSDVHSPRSIYTSRPHLLLPFERLSADKDNARYTRHRVSTDSQQLFPSECLYHQYQSALPEKLRHHRYPKSMENNAFPYNTPRQERLLRHIHQTADSLFPIND